MRHVWQTGQVQCYDSSGREVSCDGSGQDGEYRQGEPWPEDRFAVHGEVVRDELTGLFWSLNANIGGFPLSWQDALAQIQLLNRDGYGDFVDWRLPNRRELRSLMSYQTRNPCLPDGHPFLNVYLNWYWTSTSAAIHPAYAWYVHLEGARMFYGGKDQYSLFWPVRGSGNGLLSSTGADRCLGKQGDEIPCPGTGQDGELQVGVSWPQPRFVFNDGLVKDKLTDLVWARRANATGEAVTWEQALQSIRELNHRKGFGGAANWRLPNINELESLVDCRFHSPSLPAGHPFTETQEGYWSSTTSFFETDWAWVLYLHKGACGVGHKPGKTFHVWPVTTLEETVFA